MPNWCSNTLIVRGSNQAEITKMVDAFKEAKFCDSIIPCPADLDITAGRVGADGSPEQVSLELREAENLKKYGVKNWYDFHVNRWGTKWDVGSEYISVDDDGLGFTASFDSAWSPPMGIAEELVARGLQVTLYYYESGMGYVGKYEDGCDDCYDYSGYTSHNVRDLIGEDLDVHWGVSESMAEWEAEEQDELQNWYEDGVEKRGLEPHGN